VVVDEGTILERRKYPTQMSSDHKKKELLHRQNEENF
jgi:hypothetical protein